MSLIEQLVATVSHSLTVDLASHLSDDFGLNYQKVSQSIHKFLEQKTMDVTIPTFNNTMRISS